MIVGVKADAWMVRNPVHPGRHIAAHLEPGADYSGMSAAEAARNLGVSRSRLSRVLNGRAPITLDLAMKLDAFGWGTAEGWMESQSRYDVAQARKRLHQPLAEAPAVIRAQELRREAEAQAEAA